jgi:L-ascorbate metabolism protein UlaG (beta-lactamase superfamily)
VPCLGDLDVSAQDRAATIRRLFAGMDAAPAPAGPALVAMNDKCSRHDGGQLAYLLMTPAGSMLVSGSAGYWRGIFSGLRPDVALLSLGGRPNVDGEPFQGSTRDYMLEQVSLLQPRRVAFCHHDPLFPGLPGVDIAPAAAALRVPGAPAGYFEMEYATPVPLFS